MREFRRALNFCVIAGCLQSVAIAHSVLFYTGSITWNGTEILIDVNFDPHLLEHEALSFNDPIDSQRLADEMARSFFVQTEFGQNCTGQVRTSQPGRMGVTLVFAIPEGVDASAIIYRPSETLSALRRQFQFKWIPSQASRARMIRLTSATNHAVLQREAPAGSDATSPNRFESPVLRLLHERNSTIKINLDIPCYQLPATMKLPLTGEIVSYDGLRQYSGQVAAWTRANLNVVDAAGEGVALDIAAVRLIRSSNQDVSDTAMAMNMLTTRLRITLVTEQGQRLNAGFIVWHGFSPAILRTPVAAETDNVSLVADLTPTQNVLEFDFSEALHPFLTIGTAATINLRTMGRKASNDR